MSTVENTENTQELTEASQDAVSDSLEGNTHIEPENATEGATEASKGVEGLEAALEKWKTLSRKNETEKKALFGELSTLKEEYSKTTEALEALKKSEKEARESLELFKQEKELSEVLSKHSLGEEARDFLDGLSGEELQEKAEKLAALKAPATNIIPSQGSEQTAPETRNIWAEVNNLPDYMKAFISQYDALN